MEMLLKMMPIAACSSEQTDTIGGFCWFLGFFSLEELKLLNQAFFPELWKHISAQGVLCALEAGYEELSWHRRG